MKSRAGRAEKVGEAVFPSVIQAFADALHGEGFASWMYLDKEKLLTTGRGNLIDTSVAGATDPMTLAWVDSSGNAASPDLIQAAINAVKARPDLVPYGGAGKSPSGESFAGLTSVHLTDDAVASLVGSSASQLASALKNYLPGFDSFPADAQLAILRYAWANGPNLPVKAPRMYAALGGRAGNLPDFRAAAQEAHWTNENADTAALIPQLFQNAADVVDHSLDVSTLVWPNSVVQTPDGVVSSTNPTTFSGDPIDWRGYTSYVAHEKRPEAPAVFGLTAFGNHSLADCDYLASQYNKWIPNLRAQFNAIASQWTSADPDAESAFATDLAGLESRWNTAVRNIRQDNASGITSDIEAGLGKVISGFGKDRTVVGAESSYQALLHAVRQKGEATAGYGVTPGDYENLVQRLAAEQKALGVAPTAAQIAVQKPDTPENTDVDTQSRKAQEDVFYWLKLGLVGVTVGLLVNAASNVYGKNER